MAPRHDNTFWNLIALQTLHQRWHAGESAGQIAEHLGCSRDAVCSKLSDWVYIAPTNRRPHIR
jgi:hypothetical protein